MPATHIRASVRWRGFIGTEPLPRIFFVTETALCNAIDYVKFFSRSHHAVIRVYDEAANVIETHEHAGDFQEP
jgi:hypothetical protein